MKICRLVTRQNWPTKTYAGTIFWPINNMCENARSRFFPFFDGIEHHFIQKTKLVQNVYHMVTMATPRSSQWRNLGDYLDILLGSCTQSVPWDHLWRHQQSIVTSSTGHKQRHWVEVWGSSFYRHVWAHYVVYKINECRYWRGELFMCSLERYFGVY